jgi:hypothetical protein
MSKHTHTHLFSYEDTKQYVFYFIFLRDLTICNTQTNFFLFVDFLKIKNNPESLKGVFLNTS